MAPVMSLMPDDLSLKKPFRSPRIPELGLEAQASFPYIVYVLECSAGKMYVGIEHRSGAVSRVRRHFDLKGAFYTQSNKPASVLLFWPAVNKAVEGYVFLTLLSQLPPRSYIAIWL